MVGRELVCVIMAGGAGTRFWPASTAERPKQFLRFFGARSLLQMAFDRARHVVDPSRIYVLTAEAFVPLCLQQLPELSPDNIVGEPLRRDTAAAVALAVALVEARHGDPVMAVLTADHKIEPTAAFAQALCSAAAGAEASGALYTLGIPPTVAATGYGYLELGEVVGAYEGLEHRALIRFVEKPDAASAERYVASGDFLWNSGMFIWRTSSMAAESARHLPAHLERLRSAVAGPSAAPLASRLREAFMPLAKVSIDVGVMEKAATIRCVPAPFAWSDVGGFVALADHLPHDDDGNAVRGRLLARDSADNIVFCDDDSEEVALIGVSGLVVVRAGSRTLVVPRDRAEEIKQLVESLGSPSSGPSGFDPEGEA